MIYNMDVSLPQHFWHLYLAATTFSSGGLRSALGETIIFFNLACRRAKRKVHSYLYNSFLLTMFRLLSTTVMHYYSLLPALAVPAPSLE